MPAQANYSSRYSSIVSEVEFSGLAGAIWASASALLSCRPGKMSGSGSSAPA